MAVQLAVESEVPKPRPRFRLPDAVPPFGKRSHRLFTALWIAALLLAVIGPAMGLYQRYSNPGDNSQLMLGSRAGIAVSPQDATQIRFSVGPAAIKAGIESGDDITAIYGLPLPRQMPVTERILNERADDPAYIAMGNLLFGTEEMEIPLTLRSPDGAVREVTVTTSELHINSAVGGYGITPLMLSFVDLVHVVFYPLLIWAAWILHRRNPRDAVSSVLSLAILLIIGAEQPSSGFLASVAVPRWVNVALYDLGNICLLAGILLFPHGKLSTRLVLLLAALPLLMVLHGKAYQALFVMFMLLAVLMLIRCLRQTLATDLRQQIRWALFGFSGYAVFRILSIAADIYKPMTGSFPVQLSFEVFAGLALGLSMLVLQLGLLVALLRFRLYDAESIISRTASVAIVTLLLGAVAAGVMEGIITQMQNFSDDDSQTPAAVVGAVMATMFIHPLHERVQKWAERRFHKNLLELREGLPEAMRDLRDVATVDEFMSDALQRIANGVHATRAAVVLGREVRQTFGVPTAEVLRWLVTNEPVGEDVLECRTDDKLFPVRVTLESSSGSNFGWLLIGPRPDGSIAGKDEQEVLEQIAPALSRSIRIALNRERHQAEFAKLMQSHQTRIERMERMLKL